MPPSAKLFSDNTYSCKNNPRIPEPWTLLFPSAKQLSLPLSHTHSLSHTLTCFTCTPSLTHTHTHIFSHTYTHTHSHTPIHSHSPSTPTFCPHFSHNCPTEGAAAQREPFTTILPPSPGLGAMAFLRIHCQQVCLAQQVTQPCPGWREGQTTGTVSRGLHV